MESPKQSFAVVVGKQGRIRVFPDATNAVIRHTSDEKVLLNPDLNALKGLHPREWQSAMGLKLETIEQPKKNSIGRTIGIAVAVLAAHIILRHFNL